MTTKDRETESDDMESPGEHKLTLEQTGPSSRQSDEAEAERITALHSFHILDTPPEVAFDRITRLAREVFKVPVALVSLVDVNRQWFKSRAGIEAEETPRNIAFCDHAIRGRQVMVVPDALLDPRFATNPLVTGEMGVRFYAGAPLIDADGMALGTLCIIDRTPRLLTVAEEAMLRDFAAQVVHELVVRAVLGEGYRKVDLSRYTDRRLTAIRQQYEALLNATGSATVIFDPSGRITSWNAAADRMFGYRASEAIGMSIESILPNVIVSSLPALPSHLSTPTESATGWHRSGRGFPIDQSLALWRDEDGAICGGAILRDASERRRGEEELQRHQMHLAEAQHIGGLGSWDWDLTTDEINISSEMAHLLGIPAGQPRTLNDALRSIHPDDQPSWLSTMAQIIAGEQAAAVTYRMMHPDGKTHIFQSRGQKVYMSDGAHLIGVVKDITEETERNAALRESERLSALGQLAGGVAHEINNLLQPIISLSDVVQEELAGHAGGSIDSDLLEDLTVVANCGRQARDIVRKILRYARQETPTLNPTNLAEALGNSVSLLGDLLPPGIKLCLRPLEGITGLASVHAGELTQVMTNLAVNADHAMKGQGTLTIDLQEVVVETEAATALGIPCGDYFLVSVGDTGCGMDPATKARIFDPFFTTKPIGQGTGLGLSMVHGILKSWGGTVSVESRPNEGTLFSLHIPVAKEV